MKGLWNLPIFSPLNWVYFIIHKPIGSIRYVFDFKYKLWVFFVWAIILLLFIILLSSPNNASLVNQLEQLLQEHGLVRLLAILFFYQTLAVVSLLLPVYKLTLTKDVFVVNWLFLPVIIIPLSEVFAIDVSGRKKCLSIYQKRGDLGGTILEIAVSDPKTGFYFQASENFILKIKEIVGLNKLTKNVIDFPDYDVENNFKIFLEKVYILLSQKKDYDVFYLILLFLNPFTIFLVFTVFVNNVLNLYFIMFIVSFVIDKLQVKTALYFYKNYNEIPDNQYFYDDFRPLSERMKQMNQLLIANEAIIESVNNKEDQITN